MKTLNMPSFGSDMDIGKVVEWVAKPGKAFTKGETLALIETAKGLIDMEAFEDGVIDTYLIDLDKEVPVGTPILSLKYEPVRHIVGDGDEKEIERNKLEEIEDKSKFEQEAITAPLVETSIGSETPKDILGKTTHRASPAARVYAAEHGIDLDKVKGTGPLGSIVLKDLKVETTSNATSNQKGFDTKLMRKAIASVVSQSKKEIPHYYLAHTINIETLQIWLDAQNNQKTVEERLLIQAPILCAIKNALKKYPQFNGFYNNEEFIAQQQINLGVAISLRGGGLIAPAILDAGTLNPEQLMKRLKSISERAKQGGIKQSEVTSATITISNIGDRGIEVIYGVIFPPQVAILGIGKVQRIPVAVDNKVQINSMLTITLAADHRVTDGHDGAKLLNEIDKQLQKPEAL